MSHQELPQDYKLLPTSPVKSIQSSSINTLSPSRSSINDNTVQLISRSHSRTPTPSKSLLSVNKNVNGHNQSPSRSQNSTPIPVPTPSPKPQSQKEPKLTALWGWKTISFKELPEWAKDNEYIHKYYRPISPSFIHAFSTVFRIHNETGNIWTHLLAFMMFIYAAVHYAVLLPNDKFTDPLIEKTIFMTFFFGACICFGFSWTFHTVCCHGNRVSCIFAKLDYSGIALMVMGSKVPFLYYSFYCDTVWKFVYILIMCTLGTMCVLMSQSETFSQPEYRGLRAGIFSGLGLSAIIPVTHIFIQFGFYHSFYDTYLWCMVAMALFYLVGAAIYASRVPERFAPGKFDLIGHSHQIFHCFVVIAACFHMYAIYNLQVDRNRMGKVCYY